MTEKIRVGAAPMRLQTPFLHDGHKLVIDTMFLENDIVIILLGVSPIKLSKRNPLDYKTRRLMVKELYPKAIVIPLDDIVVSDKAWSESMDDRIEALTYFGEPKNSNKVVTLYGSRESFAPYYEGVHKIKLIDSPDHALSATSLRDKCVKDPLSNESFRRGVIYATNDRFNISYQTVDAFIVSSDGYVLLGRKPHNDRYCLIGGFVEPSNPSFEDAIVREVKEETGLTITTEPRYLFSTRVEDRRYKTEDDKIMTAVFEVVYDGDKKAAKGADDIEEVKWFSMDEIKDVPLNNAHKLIVDRIISEILTK